MTRAEPPEWEAGAEEAAACCWPAAPATDASKSVITTPERAAKPCIVLPSFLPFVCAGGATPLLTIFLERKLTIVLPQKIQEPLVIAGFHVEQPQHDPVVPA